MSTTSIKDKKFTQKLMASPRTALFVAGLLALVVDTAAMIAFASLGVKMALCYVILSLMLVLDAVFLLEILFSNFRLPYAKHSFIGHTALLVLLSVGNIWLSTLIADGEVFTTLAIIAWCAVHIAICVGYIICVVKASRGHTGSGTASMVAALVVAVATVAYTVLLISIGFFGQGAPPRTLVYTLNEETGTYHVSGVLDGRGKEIIVPDTFNGAEVTGIDCSIFGAKGVETITIESANENLLLLNVEALTDMNLDLNLKVHKNSATMLRDKFYSLASGFAAQAPVFELANRIVPCGLAEDEVFVTFGYDPTTYAMVDGNTLPIWIGKVGATFDTSIYTDNLLYAARADYQNGAHLKWCVEEMDGYQFGGFTANGISIENTEVYQSVGAIYVTFNKVYTLSIAEDNDTMYALPESFTNSQLDTGVYDSAYRYVTLRGASEYFASAPKRAGFTMAWKNSDGTISDMASFLENANHTSPITLTPTWTLKAPSIGNLVITGSEGNNLVYGHDVTLTTDGVTHDADVSYRYQWLSETGAVLASSDTLSMTNVLPSQSGIYKLAVEAYSNDLTSLTARSEKTVVVNIAKRELGFTWNLPDSFVYSASDKSISAEHNALQVINGDTITFDLKCNTIRNVGNYNAALELTGDAADKYAIASSDVTRSFTITPFTTSVVWTGLETVYNGNVQKPSATAAALGSDSLTIILSRDGMKNAGSYPLTASIDNPNYTLENTTATFEIAKKQITATWESATSFIYDGKDQIVKLESVTGAIDGESSSVLGSIIYTGAGKNVGSYTSVATLPTSSNYKFATASIEKAYTITKREIAPTWAEADFVYNGQNQIAKFESVSGAVIGEEATILASIIYSGHGKNAGPYTAVATLPSDSNYCFATDSVSQSFTIAKRIVSPTWSNLNLTYNGTTQTVNVQSLHNVVTGEESLALSQIRYSGHAQKNAGSYTVNAEFENNSNYKFAATTFTNYTIGKKTITATWSNLDLTYNATTQNVFVATLTGCVDSELDTILASLTLTGDANKNAGSYTATATLPSDSNYTFSGSDRVTVDYTIAKFALTPVWSENTFIYDGAEKSVLVESFESYIALELTDTLNSLSYSSNTQKNAGSYTATIALPQDSNYILTANSCAYSIAKRVLTPVWGNTDFIYGGGDNTVTLESLGNCVYGEEAGVLASIIYSGNTQKNAGSYTATATLPASSNYVFEGTVSTSYKVEKRAIGINWASNTFIYNGSLQFQAIESLNNCVDGEDAAVLSSITYNGKQKNAGTHTVTAVLPANSNYVFDGDPSTTYTIEKKELYFPVWSGTELIYNGLEQTVKVIDLTGFVNSEKSAVLASLIYSGNVQKNAGSYTATAELPADSNYYCSEPLTVDFTIAKKEISANWGTASFTYDGQEHTVLVSSLSGVVTADKDATLASLIYTENYATTAGSYTAKVELPDDSNYTLKASTATKAFEIKKKTVSLSWGNTTFTYDGTSHSVEVTKVNGTAVGEETMVLNTLIFENDSQTNAGTYIVTVSLPDDGNYCFSGTTYSITKEYTVKKRTLTPTWNPETLTITTLGNCVAGEEAEVLASITYTGNTETEVGSHTAIATLPEDSNYQFASGASTIYHYEIQPEIPEDSNEEA